MKTKIDPIKSEVIARFLLATAEEMGATLMRTAFSPNIKERADCSTAIFNTAGEVIALAQRVPIHLGSMVGAVDEILKRFPAATIKPGDMFVANDPYNGGGTHLPDINVIAPVFKGKKIVAFVANIAHHADVGGMVPGSEAAVCKSIYQEGIRIPPVRIMREGVVNRDVVDIILLNSRTPDERVGDLNAQFAANTVGARSVLQLFDRYGLRETQEAVAGYLDFTEKRFRAAINKLPPGRYVAEDFLDGNVEGETCAIKLALTIAPGNKGRMDFDFTGSGKQLESAQHSVSRVARHRVHRGQSAARPGGARQRRLLPHAAHPRACGLCGGACAASGDWLSLHIGECVGRCNRKRAVASHARQSAGGQRAASFVRVVGHRPTHGRVFRGLRNGGGRHGCARHT